MSVPNAYPLSDPRSSVPFVIIDCSSCTMRDLACGDCVVSAFLDAPAALNSRELNALNVLSDSGLVAPLRLVRAKIDPHRSAV